MLGLKLNHVSKPRTWNPSQTLISRSFAAHAVFFVCLKHWKLYNRHDSHSAHKYVRMGNISHVLHKTGVCMDSTCLNGIMGPLLLTAWYLKHAYIITCTTYTVIIYMYTNIAISLIRYLWWQVSSKAWLLKIVWVWVSCIQWNALAVYGLDVHIVQNKAAVC